MSPRAGQLRERVTFQAKARVTDAGGGSAETWGNISPTPTVWGRVEPLSGQERVQAMQVDARASHRVTIRYRTDVTPAQRVRYRSRSLYPIGPWLNEDERRDFLTAVCREDADA